MRKGRMPSIIALLLVNGPIRTGAQPGAVVLTQRRLGTIWERIVPRLPSGSKNVGNLRVAAAVPVAGSARLDQYKAGHPSPRPQGPCPPPGPSGTPRRAVRPGPPPGWGRPPVGRLAAERQPLACPLARA